MRKKDKEIIWHEDDIREVLAEFDNITGLKGAELPVLLGKGEKNVSLFCNEDGGSFHFSKVYFHDKTWPIEEAIEAIRHEYAHYMDFVRYGHTGHGESWEKCCKEISVLRLHFACRDREVFFKRKSDREQELLEKMNTFKDGDKIKHPQYGIGTILVIYGPEFNPQADVYFKLVGTKQFPLMWIAENCKRNPVTRNEINKIR